MKKNCEDSCEKNLLNESLKQKNAEFEERYRMFFENTTDIAFSIDTAGIIDDINRSGLSMLGFTGKKSTELNNKSLKQLFRYKKSFSKFLKDVNAKGYLTNFSFDLKNDKKQVFPCLLSAQLMQCIDSQKTHIVGIIKNISEKKQLESQLKSLLEQNQEFGNITAEILSVTDEKILFDRICRAIVEISDYKRCLISYFVDYFPGREIIGYAGLDDNLVDKVRKIEMPKGKYLVPLKKGIRLAQQSYFIPHTLKNVFNEDEVIFGESSSQEENELLWHPEDNLFVMLKDEKGEIIGSISVDESKSGKIPDNESVRPLENFANQISQIIKNTKLQTKLADSEHKYRVLIESARDLIFQFDLKTDKLEYINPSVKSLLGYRPDELYSKSNILKYLIHEEDLPSFIKFIPKKGKRSKKEIEVRFRTKKGGYIEYSLMIYPVEIETDKKIYGCIARDLTEHKRAESLERKLEKERVLLQMAGAAAHELNQPLTALMGRIDLASKRADDLQSMTKNLGFIKKAAMTIIETVQKIQSIERYETKEYVGDTLIIDLDKSSKHTGN